MTTEELRRIVDELFEQEALIIGGLVAFYQPDDEFVWKLARSLNVLRVRFARRIESAAIAGRSPLPPQPNLKPHPAIQKFLRAVRRHDSLQKKGTPR